MIVREPVNPIRVFKCSSSNKPKNNNLGKKVWGSVVRKLRNMPGKTILWVACQEMAVDLDGDNLILTVDGETEKSLISKQENIKCLQSLVNEVGNYQIKIKQKDKYQNDEKSNESEMKAFFGDTLKIIK